MINIKYFFTILFFLLFLATVIYRYEDYVIGGNFMIDVHTICDPSVDLCFEGSEEYSFGQNPYKKVSVLAKYAPKCLEEHNCENFVCSVDLENSNACQITYCSEETKLDGESCLSLNQ